MIVLAIIGLIFSFVGVNVIKKFQESKVQSAKIQIANYEQALQAYYLDNNRYPHTTQGLQSLVEKPTVGKEPRNWNGPYIKKRTLEKDPWGKEYSYSCEDYQNYKIRSDGPDDEPDTEDDISSE